MEGAYLDPMIDLDIRIRRVEVDARAALLLHHLVAAGQLHADLELGRPHVVLAEQVAQQVGGVARHALVARGGRGARVVGHAAAGRDLERAARVGAVAGRVGALLEQLYAARRLETMHALVAREVLHVLRDEHLQPVTLHLGQRRQLEGNGHLRAEREALAGDDDVVMQLVLPVATDSDGLDGLEAALGRRADQRHVLAADQVRAKGASALHHGLELVAHAAELDVDALGQARVDGQLKVIDVVARREQPVPLLRHRRVGRGLRVVVMVVRLEREALEFTGGGAAGTETRRGAVAAWVHVEGRHAGRDLARRRNGTLERSHAVGVVARVGKGGIEEGPGVIHEGLGVLELHLPRRNALGPIRFGPAPELEVDGLDLGAFGDAQMQTPSQHGRARLDRVLLVEALQEEHGLGQGDAHGDAVARRDGLLMLRRWKGRHGGGRRLGGAIAVPDLVGQAGGAETCAG